MGPSALGAPRHQPPLPQQLRYGHYGNFSPLRIYGPLTKQLGDLWLSIFTLRSVQYGARSRKGRYRKPLRVPMIDRGREEALVYK